ncbi:pyridoxamine 5'-phosphate oxidase [Flavobacterium sp.]|uniref:pyridoxamine 5'-phosphate oxidase n=1 Tax=Flavobacterium sp. TaxID=239 RepID=UPI003753B3B3
MKDLNAYRKSYEKSELLENSISSNAMELFHLWFQEAENSDTIEEVNAMTVATIGLDGFPKSRVVLLKQYSEAGFVFYTNYNSEKGKAIENNPNVCLSFFWHSLERQIIIKGIAAKVKPEISDAYFASRPKGSQLGAVVSNQSEIIASRAILEQKLTNFEIEFINKQISRPESWGGYIVKALEIEFWQGRPNRLHDRIRFKANDNFGWKMERLSP